MIVVASTEIVSAQSSLTKKDSCICYTDAMDKKALECLINSPKKDSLISNYGLQIHNFKSVTANQSIMITDLENTNREKDENIVKLNLHLSRSRRLVKISGGVGFAVGVVGTIFLMK